MDLHVIAPLIDGMGPTKRIASHPNTEHHRVWEITTAPASPVAQWISILEAATPENATIFAAPVDHRIVPPLSYTEMEAASHGETNRVLSAAVPGSSVGSSCSGSKGGKQEERPPTSSRSETQARDRERSAQQ